MLDDLRAIARLDRSAMLEKVAALPATCLEGWGSGLEWKIPPSWGGCAGLLALGMGGSAIGADLLQGFLRDQLRRPVVVNRTYTLPAWINRDWLVLACSYSGNTEETLSAARQAKRRGARVAAITSGGEISRWATGAGLPLLEIPAGWPPRSAVGYLAFAPMGMLVRLGWLKEREVPVPEAIAEAQRLVETALSPRVKTGRNPAKRMAKRLAGTIPVIYGASEGWEGITYRWRTQLEENAKTMAFHHLFPEATHNEVSGWLHPKPLMRHLAAVFLTDPAVHPRTLRRMEFAAGIVRRQGAAVVRVPSAGSTLMGRMLKHILMGDFTSVYLGLLYRMDPTPVARVEALKRYMMG